MSVFAAYSDEFGFCRIDLQIVRHNICDVQSENICDVL